MSFSAPNCCDTEERSASQPGSVASGKHCVKKKYRTSQRKNEKGGIKEGRDSNKEGRKQNIGK